MFYYIQQDIYKEEIMSSVLDKKVKKIIQFVMVIHNQFKFACWLTSNEIIILFAWLYISIEFSEGVSRNLFFKQFRVDLNCDEIKRYFSIVANLTNYFEFGFYLRKSGISLWIIWFYFAVDFGEPSKAIFTINTSDGLLVRKKD